MIQQPLVIEHKIADLQRQLGALPSAFQATSLITSFFRARLTYSPDPVGRCTKFVICHVSHCHSVTSGTSCFLSGTGGLSGGIMRGIGGRASLRRRYLAPRPSASLLYRSARSVVTRSLLFEEVQNVLRAIGRPLCEKAMFGVL